MDKVSIIIPCYNVQQYLDRCINSVIAQTYSNIEIVLINDGSTDSTKFIIDEYSRRYKNIKAIDNIKNLGLEETRNRGIDLSSGDWLMFLDGDDFLEPFVVESYMDIASEENDVDYVFANFTYYYDNAVKNIDLSSKICTGIYSSKEMCNMLFSELEWKLFSCVGTKFIRTNFVKSNNIKFEPCYKYNEDAGFAINLLRHSQKIGYLNKSMYMYYQREGSIMHSYRKNMYKTMNNVINLLQVCFEEKGCINTQLVHIHEKRLELIYASLLNEYQFRGKDDYKHTFSLITHDNDAIDTCKFFLKNRNSIKQTFLSTVLLLRIRLIIILYFKAKGH